MDGHPVILFDDRCGLCARTVEFVLRRDRRGRFSFAALDSPFARSSGAPPQRTGQPGGTVLLLDGGRVFERSDAVLRILRGLGGAWRIAALLLLVPRSLRDAVYDVVSRHRLRWFGRLDACYLPPPGQEHRFVVEDPDPSDPQA